MGGEEGGREDIINASVTPQPKCANHGLKVYQFASLYNQPKWKFCYKTPTCTLWVWTT